MIVAEGPPETIVETPESYTGRFLREVLERRPVQRLSAAE